MTLDQLSAAATEGEWKNDPGFQSRSYLRASGGELVASFSHIYGTTLLPAQINCSFVAALVNAYRTGQLVAVADDAVERVARTLAPNLEGGREFDQMPKDRAQLRQWTAQGMCLINDATQDDATWLAQEAIKAAKGAGGE